MSINPGEEFKLKATPSPELARKLAYLAAQDNDSVLTGGHRSTAVSRAADAVKARRADMLLQMQMARLADPAYQALSERINGKLDLMDEASVHALQEIEQELADLRRERERMLEQAYRDEQGNAIFMTKDGRAAYYEDGGRVEDEKFAAVQDELRGKPTWEEMLRHRRKEDELSAERDLIHGHDAERDRLRDDLAHGRISKEEAERREREIEESLPERVRPHYARLSAQETDAAPPAALSAEESARLDPRGAPESESGAGASVTPPAPTL